MTQDEIISMAREAGMAIGFTQGIAVMNHENLERFAALVAADEREACAKVCEDIDTDSMIQNWKSVDYCARECAAAIRQRGEK